MSTFRQDVEITLDGEVFKCQTKAIDYTNAERQLVHDGGKVDTDVLSLRFRVAWCCFRRWHAEHPAARAFGVFLDTLDDLSDESGQGEGDPMDPPRAAASDI